MEMNNPPTNLEAPPRSKLVGGVWLPETETHLEEWMTTSKRAREVEGKLTYQYHKLEAALRHQPLERRRTCADIGAHVGLWSMWLIREFDTLHAFEPVPWFADIFHHNVDPMRPEYWLDTLHRVALGARQGVISISVPLASTGASHFGDRADVNAKFDKTGKFEHYHGIEIRTLDQYGYRFLDFIKIDVEGMEADVIRGGEETIRRCRPNIVVEQKGNDTAYGEPRDAAKALLESWGMKPLEVISGDWIMGW